MDEEGKLGPIEAKQSVPIAPLFQDTGVMGRDSSVPKMGNTLAPRRVHTLNEVDATSFKRH